MLLLVRISLGPSPDVRRLDGSPLLLHLRLALHHVKQLLPFLVMMMVTAPLCPLFRPPPDPPPCKFLPLASLSLVTPPEPPDPPDVPAVVALLRCLNTSSSLFPLAMTQNPDLDFLSLTPESRGRDVPFLLFGVSSAVCGCLFSIPSTQALSQISILKPPSRMATKNGGGGGSPVSASDTSLTYRFLSPVIYRFVFGCVDWPSISSCFDLPTTPSCKVFQGHLSSFYSANIEYSRQLFVWVTLELRYRTLVGDIPMDLVLLGSTFATSSRIYIALARSSAVCSSCTGSMTDVGIGLVYLSSLWQVEEKFIVIFSPWNMDVAGYGFPLVPQLNQSSFLIFPPIWSELDEHVSLVLQGSSSHRMLSAYGAVCVVLRVTLDAIFEEAYDIVVIQFHMIFYDLYRHFIPYVIVVVCLAVNSPFVSSSSVGA
ncbi:hypothetical protein HID58_058167 [Brassica napus]|uniref:Uncharacterized protein n=1 Tax=Brassica napus TaxID=3708 RepID=A0ABQ7ZPG1_BRANA|nr:hypothetical protein HID58_058167 [Brassica napus]